jgi:hypothetical protein
MTLSQPTVRPADSPDAPAISDLLYEFNGKALRPEDLAQRLAEVSTLDK